MAKKLDPQCQAFHEALALLDKPWTALILTLLHEGSLRFSEIEERGHGVGAKMLSARLKELELRGLLVRSIDAGPPVRVHYALTKNGRAFGGVARAIEAWGRVIIESDKVDTKRSKRHG